MNRNAVQGNGCAARQTKTFFATLPFYGIEHLFPALSGATLPTARQIRPIVERLNPERSAMKACDQCVAFGGVCSNVATITRHGGRAESLSGGPVHQGRCQMPASTLICRRPRRPGTT
ncbi:hypothetical protein GCM10009608_84250 [Pseudonocardia alaniniphila]